VSAVIQYVDKNWFGSGYVGLAERRAGRSGWLSDFDPERLSSLGARRLMADGLRRLL
jgi:hypothetical protein